MAELVVSRIIKIVLVVLLIITVLGGIIFSMSGSFNSFFKNLPGDKKVIEPLSCEEYCINECNEQECMNINNQWKEYYEKNDLKIRNKCVFENNKCVEVNN